MLITQNLTYKEKNSLLLLGVNFHAKQSCSYEIICKDTHTRECFADLLCGVITPTEGSVTIIDTPKGTPRVGYIPENMEFYPEMTVAEYLSFLAELKGLALPRSEQAIKSALSATDLTVVRNVIISKLNANARARLALCTAALGTPEIVVINNACEGLSGSQANDILKLIKSLFKDKSLILLTCEEISEPFCTHRYTISDGILSEYSATLTEDGQC